MSKRDGMRVGIRTLLLLALCAATAGAAAAHTAIDAIGDYALAHDSYDNLAHGSRELVSIVALLVAVLLAARGLRRCCDIAAANRTRLLPARLGWPEAAGFLMLSVTVSLVLVPAMEWLDGRAAGVPVRELADAFGGSILLGFTTTAVCAGLIALTVFAIAQWLISHRETIVAIIATVLRWSGDGVRRLACSLDRTTFTVHRRRTLHTPCLSKRGPPVAALA